MASLLWNEWFWLPEGATWSDLKSNETIHYPQFYELSYSILAGALLLLCRMFFECCVYLPIGYYGGWMSQKESIWSRIFAHLKNNVLGGSNKDKFKRVAETAWRLTFYTTIWIVGMCVLWDQPQFWEVNECYRNWPNHHLESKVWWYYIVETGFYWALLFRLHHLVTIVLLSVSWTINFVRVGTLILICHDSADILLLTQHSMEAAKGYKALCAGFICEMNFIANNRELGKLFRYARWSAAVTGIFVVFLLTWIGSRLVYFPGWIIYSMIVEAPKFVQKSYRWENLLQRPIITRLLMVMLLILLMLHVFWTYLLLKIAVKSLKSGVDDIREDSDDDSDQDLQGMKKKE